MRIEGSKWTIRASKWPVAFIRFETICAALLGVFFMALSLGPRIPLPIDVGRRVDLRIHEVLILLVSFIAIYSLMCKKNPKRLSSPWSPWFSIAFIFLALALVVKTTIGREQLFLSLGYSFRTIMFFITSVTIFIIAYNSRSRLEGFTLPLIFTAFGINAVHIIYNGLQGNNSFIEDLNGMAIQQYSPGLLGEPNGLAAGIFFVYFLVAFAQRRSTSPTVQRVLSMGIIISLICVYMTSNRSSMIMAVVVIVLQLGSSVNRKTHLWTIFYALVLVTGAVSFFILNPRGSSETVGGALAFGRIPQWTRSLDLLKENPILGWNFGSNEPHQAFLRLVGEFGIMSAALFLFLLLVILWRSPRSESLGASGIKVRYHYQESAQTGLPNDDYWVRVLKQFLAVLLVGGLLTDSLTPVQSWDLLAFSVGMAWATWYGVRPESNNFSYGDTAECEAVIESQWKSPPK